ncbi:restriction endonuclease [Kitasatospora mediocidica]|uniref:restriction endonuclease n=1 Tax=Kitasatospora mediocidica TaxID=58352 RepID=UPI0007C69AC8|nr:restriction endonuclease [Kitasatospora mediocidica]
MAGRRNNGVLAAWAEEQRQEQRRWEAQRRAEAAAQRQAERQEREAAREAERAAVRGEREAVKAYQQGREAEAARRTSELEAQVAQLQGVLVTGLAQPGFPVDALLAPVRLPAFDPGPLGVPVAMPDPSRYQAPPPGGLLQRRRYEEQQAQERSRFEYDWQQAQTAEADRRRRLTEYHQAFLAWESEQRRQDAERIAQVGEQLRRLRQGDPEAVQEYFTAVLYGSAGWPENFPRRLSAAWDPNTRQLAVGWELPPFDVVPATARVRYVKTDDRENEVARSATERRRLYREVLAQSALRVLHELFRADRDARSGDSARAGLLESVALTGFVHGVDPATGRETSRVLLAVHAGRAEFAAVALDRVAPVECLEGLRGRLSARPERLEEVRPERLPETVGASVAGQGQAGDPDLFTMDPIEFEELIAELFRLRGFRVMTTARSGDEGVDVLAEDPDPVTGGKIVIQAKRYRHTVSPTAVRDLDSTVRHHGARQGILVTTAGFGPGSYSYIAGKPLALITGPELVALLAEQGLRGRLGGAEARESGENRESPGSRGRPAAALSSVRLEVGWQDRTAAGDPVELDVCAFLCAGGRVLSDEHFVFFNNLADPSGAVHLRTGVPSAAGRATRLSIALDRLPPEVDEVAVAVATDEESAPALPLGYVHGLTLTARGGEPVGWTGGTGGVAESAMLLGSFHRGPQGWRFEQAGTPVPGGLLGLARRWGVAVG